jgi:formylglycine-generating enzyme required for sulfatase activity/cephalosporin-C deacetylase-like acetyl esterase/predicted Ser/Thr protein kinase
MTAEKLLSHYELLEKLGEGGMGALYRARDTRLNRTVAIKLLREGGSADPDRARRLVQEARAACQLNDPHIVTIYEVDDSPGREFIAMELVDGESLSARLSRGPLPMAEVLRIAVEAAEGLAAAHAAGIVHRDLKPSNVMLSTTGRVKLLDFGLAKVAASRDAAGVESLPTLEAAPRTRTGAILGTPAYMSPEQAEGKRLDARSDVFSFGVMLYELLTGRRPFGGETDIALLAAILRDEPEPPAKARPDTPAALTRILARCLEKKPEARYADGAALLEDLRACRDALAAPARPPRWRQPSFLAATVVVLLALAGAVFATWRAVRERDARRQRARIDSIREQDGEYTAYLAARALRPVLAGDPAFERAWGTVTLPVSLRSEPPGATVSFKLYARPDAPWESIGTTPIDGVPAPFGYLRWKLEKEGFEPMEMTFDARDSTVFRLVPKGESHGMARVQKGPALDADPPIEIPDTWLDVYEVTNAQYKAFVDAGGYREERFWKEPFVKDGRTLSFDEAMALFRDATGRPGPSTWELGGYPDGQAEIPVGGVSWYEASAYAEFAGKRLPTYHDWYRAAGPGLFSEVLGLSNFGGKGPAPVSSQQGLTPWGHYDMAGNVKEWVENAVADTPSRRYALGGAWNDSSYMFADPDAADAFDRRPVLGFRCARSDAPPQPAALAPVGRVARDYTKEKPVGDETFAAYARLFAYDPSPLDVRKEGPDDQTDDWRMERLSFASAYGERIPARLYVPRGVSPPYQAILFYPSGVAALYPSLDRFPDAQYAFLVRSGRAVLCPVYQNTLERRHPGAGPNAGRDYFIQAIKDARRSVELLSSRPDIDASRLGYFGISLGGNTGLRILALEPRLRAAVLAATGLSTNRLPPEIDRLNFAPRIHQPVLLVNGRDDFLFPLETTQRPLFNLLGTPPADKKLVLLDGGHVVPRSNVLFREALDWFDKYLGPVAVGK